MPLGEPFNSALTSVIVNRENMTVTGLEKCPSNDKITSIVNT